MNQRFWTQADQLLSDCEILIDRPKGSRHPHWDFAYELDYGYLRGTQAMDGGGIDVWVGSLTGRQVTGAIVTIDLRKRDAEVKLLVNCTPAEMEYCRGAHNAHSQAGLLCVRPIGSC